MIIIRRMGFKDMTTVSEFAQENTSDEDFPILHRMESHPFFLSIAKMMGGILYIAFDDEVMVGYMGISPGGIARLRVGIKHRKRGIASKLIEHLSKRHVWKGKAFRKNLEFFMKQSKWIEIPVIQLRSRRLPYIPNDEGGGYSETKR